MGFLTIKHTILNLIYSVFLNVNNYRSCNKENLANLLGKNGKEWIHYLRQK